MLSLFLFNLSLLFLDELLDEFLLIDLVVNLILFRMRLFLHNKNGLVSPVLDEFVLDILVHHVESILDVILCSAWHFLDDL